MDVVQQHRQQVHAPSGGRKTKTNSSARRRKMRDSSSSVKVVYISTPMKVKTSASRFRSLVQELTGRNSDVARIMETTANSINHDDHFEDVPDHQYDHDDHEQGLMMINSDNSANYYNNYDNHGLSNNYDQSANPDQRDQSPTSSDSLQAAESVDDIFVGEQFRGLLSSTSVYNQYDPYQLDVLGSYDML